MPPETTKSAERCELHPGSMSVAHCARCDRTLCLTCAVPVRGVVLGPECLPADVRSEAGPALAQRPPMSRWWLAAGAALLVVLVSTVFRWTRFGVGSGWFGAWGLPLRWSTVAAFAGAGAAIVWAIRRWPGPAAARVVAGLAIGAAVAAGLALLNPPPFTTASAAPWVALVAAVAGAVFALAVARRHGS
jgi:hypothetical protein